MCHYHKFFKNDMQMYLNVRTLMLKKPQWNGRFQTIPYSVLDMTSEGEIHNLSEGGQ